MCGREGEVGLHEAQQGGGAATAYTRGIPGGSGVLCVLNGGGGSEAIDSLPGASFPCGIQRFDVVAVYVVHETMH
jgi:hypothetical protein